MVKKKELQLFVDEVEKVNVSLLMKRFDLDEEQACRVLISACREGLLLPVTTAFFTKPADGRPVDMTRRANPSWYEPRLELIMDGVKKQPEIGVTVRDVGDAMGIHINMARAMLTTLAERGDLKQRASRYGGVFGKRPMIFGLSPQALTAREDMLKATVEAKRKARKKKVEPSPAPAAPMDDPLLERLGEVNTQIAQGFVTRNNLRWAKKENPPKYRELSRRIRDEGLQVRP